MKTFWVSGDIFSSKNLDFVQSQICYNLSVRGKSGNMQKSKLTNKSPAAEIDIFPNVFLSRYLSHIQYDCAASTKIGIFQLEFQLFFLLDRLHLRCPFYYHSISFLVQFSS